MTTIEKELLYKLDPIRLYIYIKDASKSLQMNKLFVLSIYYF